MTPAQAKKLTQGDPIRVRVTAVDCADPYGRDAYIPGKGYQRDDIPAGTVVTFERIIPKVRVTKPPYPWTDTRETMLFCTWREGQRAWVNIGNADVVDNATVHRVTLASMDASA